MNKFTLKHYIGDAAVFILMTALLVCVVIFTLKGDKNNTGVSVISDGKKVALLDLSEETSYDIDGVHIKVEEGRAFIESSDCPDKVCTSMYGVDKNGGGAVCIPNRIVLEPEYGSSVADVVAG